MRSMRSTQLVPSRRRAMADAVIDASALVDLLLANELGSAVQRRIAGHSLHAPAHVDTEVLSALGRLQRAGTIEADDVETMLRELVAAPITRYPVTDLILGAWARRHQLRLVDAVYVELAVSNGVPLVTTDRRMHPVQIADVVVA